MLGFGYLEDAGRLDLTVEALVGDETQPFHGLFGHDAVEAARARLAAAHARLAQAAPVERTIDRAGAGV